MSIILRALKKIQNQEDTPPSQEMRADVERGDEPESLSVVAPTLAEEAELQQSAAIAGIFDSGGLAQSRAGISARPETTRHRLGSVPKVLIGLIFALGVFATGWFGSSIYVNFRSTAGSSDVDPQVVAAKQSTVTQGVPSQTSTEQPVARVAPESPAPPVEMAAAAAPQTPVHMPAAPAALEPAPSPAPTEAQPGFSDDTSADARPARSRGRRPAVKEATPERKGRPTFKINAIAWRAEEPKAIVNMQRVFVGDVIEGATVKAIQRKSILFEYEGETFEVRF